MEYLCYRCGTAYAAVMERCWAGCGESGYIGPSSFRAATALRPKRHGMTAFELAASDQKTYLPSSVPGLVLPRRGVVLIVGEAGAGKSTFGLQLLRSLTPAVLFAFEEGLSSTVGDRLRRLEFRSPDLWIEVPATIAEAYAVISERQPRSVLIDSVSMSCFTAGDLTAMSESFRCLIFAVCHETKAGQVAGENALSYCCDVILSVDAGKWKTTKSRVQPKAEGCVEGVGNGQPMVTGR